MKTNSHDKLEDHNLVMFPASKNFKLDLSGMELGIDPLHELLNEYSHLDEDDLPHHLDDRFDLELEEPVFDTFHSLEAFMTRNLRGERQSPDDKLIQMINDRIQAIKDAKERIKFYLNELEMFLPGRKR